MSKEEIIKQLQSVKEEFKDFCAGIDTDLFFHQPIEKWSAAQNVKHLIISANTTRLAFILPKFIVRLYTGKPNRPSRRYEELANKYKLKLNQGGRASGIYIPKIISPQTGKKKPCLCLLINQWRILIPALIRNGAISSWINILPLIPC